MERTIENAAAVSDADDKEASVQENGAAAYGSAVNALPEKTFTQKELDDIIRLRLERTKKDMPSKDELKEFREWQENRNSFEMKAFSDIAAANSAREAAEKDKHDLEIVISCLSKGVAPEYADDVITLAKKYTDENTSVDAAVDKVIERYPVFRRNGFGYPLRGITTGTGTHNVPRSSDHGTSCFIDVIKQNQVKRK